MNRKTGDDLPEVVPNQQQPQQPIESIPNASPQALSSQEATAQNWHGADRDKYPASYDSTPKYVDDGTYPPHKAWSATDPSNSPEVAHVQTAQTVPWETLPAGDGTAKDVSGEEGKEKTIFGIKRRIFIIIAVAVVVVIAAAVGGGVGGTRARTSSQDPPAAIESETSTSQPTPTSTTSSISSSTSATSSSTPTATTPAQIFLNNGTAPNGLAFQGFSERTYLGNATTIVQEEGFHDFPFPIQSYVWLPDETGCCVTFCQNKTTSTGWWCEPRFRPSFEGSFPRLYVWCGGNDGIKNETCS